ncbi:MAG: ABC transporter permease [Bacilli bacterium]|nr:ABC transporter permease [Bacilli bacterium]
MKKNNIDLENLPIEARDESIQASDFTLVDNSTRVHEQKFQTKPTTFFKDSIKRFSKNKSSVVAAGILGTLLLLSFAVPIIDRNDVKGVHPNMIYLQPKLLNAGSGFWDGTKKWENIAVDVGEHQDATTEEEKQEFWWPSPEDFKQNAVSKKTFSDVTYTSDRNNYANGGYVQFGISSSSNAEYVAFTTHEISTLDITAGDIYLKSFELYDLTKLKAEEGEDKAFFPDNYSQGEVELYFNYVENNEEKSIKLLDSASSFSVTSPINLSTLITSDANVVANSITTFSDCDFELRIKNNNSGANECVLIKSLEFETNNTKKEAIEAPNFTDANELMLREYENGNNLSYWSCTGNKKLHMAKVIYCNFTYDSYEAVFGKMVMGPEKLFESDIDQYIAKGWCNFDYTIEYDSVNDKFVVTDFDYEMLSDKCPVKDITKVVATSDGTAVQLTGEVEYFRYYGYDRMPKFLMGTDKNGRDMFKYVFEGLRTSLLLGIASFIVCFIIGLIWGSVSGYFGGTVDLVMERITDILHGVPWIVVMTLVIKHLGQTFFVFGLSLCLTGWIGTAATTRTQFYRFRGREYVLASRSLGANDARLIAKHILPNAMGTIITSSVLMIPSVIFSEATISYLGLGLKGLSSLGVILSDNQTQLTTHSYLLIFPAIVIALLMISFNLFGNGLRDAVNPSLKGEEQ